MRRAREHQAELQRNPPKYLDHLGAQLGDPMPRIKFTSRKL
jgi:hypothetical protein